MEKKRSFLAYLLWAFGIAWVLQITAGILYRKGNGAAYTIILAVSMFAPMLAVLLAGYEYGTAYWGAPVTGPLLFCLIATVMGILLDYLYEKTGCIWVPALCHGAINAFAGVPTLVLNPAYSNQLLLGPLMIGLVGGLPMILLAAWLCPKGSAAPAHEGGLG